MNHHRPARQQLSDFVGLGAVILPFLLADVALIVNTSPLVFPTQAWDSYSLAITFKEIKHEQPA